MVDKLSVSMERALAKLVRSAAAEDGQSVSTWLAEAARAKARQRALRDALAAFGEQHGMLGADEVSALIETARAGTRVSRPRAARKRRA